MNVPAHSLRYSEGDIIAGKYRLTQQLGEGGMGEVWAGVNIVLDSPVAIKLMKADLTDDVLRQRLLREARTAAGLDHPAIIRVFDVGESPDGKPYVVMERLHGASLRDLIDRPEPRDVVEVTQALLPIIDALALAHERGLVHRDVKPDNIFLSRSGPDRLQPKLLDFGVVKAQAYKRFLTHTGTVVGSPPYMSPEQARGDEDIDHLADLWAVCVILYEAATGRMPFEAPNYNALLRRIVEDEVSPVVSDNPVVASLSPIIQRGLHKDREERWQTAEELGRALASWLLKLGVGEDLCGQRLSGRWIAAGRKSIADRRRASMVDLAAAQLSTPSSTDEPDEAARAVSSNAPTQALQSAPRWRKKSVFAGAGLVVVLLGVGLGLASRGGAAAEAVVASASVPAETPKEADRAEPPPPPSVTPAQRTAPPESSPETAPPKAAAKAVTPGRKAQPRPAAPAPRPRAPKKPPTPDLGLKDPY